MSDPAQNLPDRGTATCDTSDKHGSVFDHPILWIIALSLVAYPLSIGPAVLLVKAFPATEPPLEAFYYPLKLMADHCQPLNDAITWYVFKVSGAQ